MPVLTEGQHAGEFLVSEANGALSREVGTLFAGQVVSDGAVLFLSSNTLRESVGNAAGEVIVGIVIGNHDASAGNKAGVPYIARHAEVKRALVHIDATDPDVDADTEAELLTLGIRLR